jgi:hypothetical protein
MKSALSETVNVRYQRDTFKIDRLENFVIDKAALYSRKLKKPTLFRPFVLATARKLLVFPSER